MNISGKRITGAVAGVVLVVFIWFIFINIDSGSSRSSKLSVTKTALSSLDSALERFRLDFHIYPSAVDASKGPVKHAGPMWAVVSKSLNAASWVGSEQPFTEELRLVLTKNLPQPDWGALEKRWTGPYLKSGKTGVSLDGRKQPFVLVVNNQMGVYKLYTLGKNGLDEEGRGDDEASKGSKLEWPPQPKP